ncbi:efflux RND transporter periplasmic adaptor subunit [Sphingomonas sp. TX0543]|uniref:efflux RND transporter periplasmic adaptor subunit n=1 Tax=Sphingomonas sp. TX0543 TaxID=3399682 RepID=UPI003AFA7037
MRRNLPHTALLAGLALLVAAGGALALRAVGPDNTAGAGEGAVESAIKVTGSGAQTQIVVPRSLLGTGNLAVAPVMAASQAQTRNGLATVISLQPLSQQRQSLATATAEVRRASVAAEAAWLEANRLALLHADGQIASAKALEAQRATAATETAALANARAQVALQGAGAREQFGPVLGGWIVRDAAPLNSLFAGRTLLVQVSGADLGASFPARVALILPDGGRVQASIIGRAAQADPKFQAAGFYGTVPARPGLAPGVSVPAEVPSGPPVRGVAVPDAAIIRTEGRSIVYVETRPGVFTPTPVVTGARTSAGVIVTSGLQPGARVVVRGAQLLFSQNQQGAGGGE